MSRIIDARVRLPLEFHPPETRVKPSEYTAQYDAALNVGDRRNKTLENLLEEMEEAGVEHAIIHAEYEFGDPADVLNKALARITEDNPQRFSGIGTISMEPLRPMRAYYQVEEIADLGLIGVNFQPAFFSMAIDDRRFYPVYAKAQELGLIVALHTGINYSLVHPIKNDHPLQLDQVACDFPELKLIACHGGWPWVVDMVAVARKHPNVYVEFGGLAPKYVGAPGSGWEVMYRFMNSLLSKQILFGTDWPVFSPLRALDEWRDLGLKPEVLSLLLGGNAEGLLAVGDK